MSVCDVCTQMIITFICGQGNCHFCYSFIRLSIVNGCFNGGMKVLFDFIFNFKWFSTYTISDFYI